jgi:hypothetical protein
VWMRFLFSLSIYLSSPLFSPSPPPHNSIASMSLFLLSSPAPPPSPALAHTPFSFSSYPPPSPLSCSHQPPSLYLLCVFVCVFCSEKKCKNTYAGVG